MKCPNCQFINSETALFCSDCGSRMKTENQEWIKHDIILFISLIIIIISLSGIQKSALYNYFSTIRKDQLSDYIYFLEEYPNSRYTDRITVDLQKYFPKTFTKENNFAGVDDFAHNVLNGKRSIEAMTEDELRFINLSFKYNNYPILADIPFIKDQLVSAISNILGIAEFKPLDYLGIVSGYIRCFPDIVSNNLTLLESIQSHIYTRTSTLKTIPISRLEDFESEYHYLQDISVINSELSETIDPLIRNSIQKHNNNLFDKIKVAWSANRDLTQFDNLSSKFQSRFQRADITTVDSIGRIVHGRLDSLAFANNRQNQLEEQYEEIFNEVITEVVSINFEVIKSVDSEFGYNSYLVEGGYGQKFILETINITYKTTGWASLDVRGKSRESTLYINNYTKVPLDVFTEYLGDKTILDEKLDEAAKKRNIGKTKLKRLKLLYKNWETAISAELDNLFKMGGKE